MAATRQRIALVKPCCIGDSVMALPALDSLAACRPGSTIDVFCGRHSTAIFEHHPAVARTITTPDIPTWRDVLPLARRFRRGRYDSLVLLDRSRYLLLAARLSGARGVARPIPSGETPRHESDIYLDVIGQLGCAPATSTPRIAPPEAARERAAAIAAKIGKPFIAIQPGGAENPGARMTSKRWPVEGFAAVLRWAGDQGLGAVLTGGPSDRALCEEVVRRAESGDATILAGRASLIESAAVVERAALYVGVDTGMSHIAAAVGTPTIAIFGPTNPLRYGPRGEHVAILAPPESERIPDADLRRLGDTGSLPSTTRISVEEVIAASKRLLGQREGMAR